MTRKLSEVERSEIIDKLVETILNHPSGRDTIRIAFIHGRLGYKDLSDKLLRQSAETWGVPVPEEVESDE